MKTNHLFKFIGRTLQVALVCCSVMFFAASCSDDDDPSSPEDVSDIPVKLVESIKSEQPGYSQGFSFKYDADGRIIEQINHADYRFDETITYSYHADGRLASSQTVSGDRTINATYTMSGKTLLITEVFYYFSELNFTLNHTLHLDDKGRVSRWDRWRGEDFDQHYTYDDRGNVIKMEDIKDEVCIHRYEYTYDQKPAPFYSVNMPQWYFIINDIFHYSRNNMKAYSNYSVHEGESGEGSATITYDSDGYPSQSILTWTADGKAPGEPQTVTYTYVK